MRIRMQYPGGWTLSAAGPAEPDAAVILTNPGILLSVTISDLTDTMDDTVQKIRDGRTIHPCRAD